MNIGPLGSIGAPLAQTKGSGPERAHGEIAAQGRRTHYTQKADAAAGVSGPDGDDHEPDQRGADGRRPWEEPSASTPEDAQKPAPPSKDPSQERGNLLDLNG
jgi:hypothetical protein